MPLWWWLQQQVPFPASGRDMATPRGRCGVPPRRQWPRPHLPFTNSGSTPSLLHQRGRAVVEPRRRRLLARSPAAAAPTRLRSPSPWWRRLRVWCGTMSTKPSRPHGLVDGGHCQAFRSLPFLGPCRRGMGESTSNP